MCSLLPYDAGVCLYASIFILYLFNLKINKKSVFSSLSLFFVLFLFFCFLTYCNTLDGMVIPASPSLMCSFNSGNIEETKSSKICV